jgi:O-antigen ligase
VILFVHALEQRKKKLLLQAFGLGSVILVGIILNNRRLAFVSLALASLVIYLALDRSKRKRRVTIALAIAVPLLVGYVLVGSEATSKSALFKPAKSIASVLDQRDTSSISRDIENENLIYTLGESPLLTRGFGHEYDYSPSSPPVDLSEVFENYRLIAHNGVLWLWSIAGVIGFSLLWFIFPMGATLALRGYRTADTSLERSASLASLGATAICVVQIWGDQGLSSYMTLVVFALAFAVASRLAARTTRNETPYAPD